MKESGAVASGPGEVTRALWGASQWGRRVAILGVGHAVGREVACALLGAGHPPGSLALYGRAPRSFVWRGMELAASGFAGPVQACELAFLCSSHPDAIQLAGKILAAGARVIDLSESYRGTLEVPLVGTGPPEAHEPIGAFTPVIALPSRTALVVYPALAVLEQACGLEQVSVVCLCSAATDGARGILTLRQEFARVGTDGAPPAPASDAAAAPGRVGNLLAAVGRPAPGGTFSRELELAADLRRLLLRADLAIDATAVAVDVERCDSVAYRVLLRRPLELAEAAALFASSPFLAVEERPRGPVPTDCVLEERVHVGRIRAGSAGASSLCFFAVGDQLRFGAAVAALHVAGGLRAA